MAGKRPDQHNIDPREGRASDHKNLPETAHGRGGMDDSAALDRRRVSEDEADMRAGSGPLQGDRPSPSRYTRYGRPLESRDEDEEQGLSGREREARGTEDPRDRGVGG